MEIRFIQCRKDTDTHLQALKDDVDSVINEAIKTDKDRENEDAAKINQETDEKNQKLQEEILKINEKIRKNDDMREQATSTEPFKCRKKTRTQSTINNIVFKQIFMNIAEEKERKIGELENAWQDDTKTTENYNTNT